MAFNRSGVTGAVPLDISKALALTGLLHKLRSYGISGHCASFLRSYGISGHYGIVLLFLSSILHAS